MRAEPLTLVQVVPPGHGGVRDYVDCLQAEWQRCGTPSAVIALSKALAKAAPLVEQINALQAQHTHATSRLSVVLHYSGYGYGHRGLCFWLLDQIRCLRARRRDALRLVVVFHELYASGPPWRSAFWLTAVQAGLAARLAHDANAVWTNSAHHAQWLHQKVRADVPLHVRPVFSNVGEPDHLPDWAARKPQAVVFGSASTRQRAFDEARQHESVLRSLGIQDIFEVGPGPASSGRLTTLPTHHLGRLDTDALGRLLLASRVGLLDYPSSVLGKSGVLAAYAAHGCAVLNTRTNGVDTDGLLAGRDYMELQTPASESSNRNVQPQQGDLQAISSRLYCWYAEHRLSVQARELMTLCRT